MPEAYGNPHACVNQRSTSPKRVATLRPTYDQTDGYDNCMKSALEPGAICGVIVRQR